MFISILDIYISSQYLANPLKLGDLFIKFLLKKNKEDIRRVLSTLLEF